jgi:hypothetical protein
MVQIRIKEKDRIQYKDKQSEFSKQNRHGSLVKSFILRNGQLEFFDAELETKMIPKKFSEDINNIPLKQIITDNCSLMFQDPQNALRFLVYNNGWIESVSFDDLTEDDDILIFDENEHEWALANILELKRFSTYVEDEDLEREEAITQMFHDSMAKTFSPYIIRHSKGMIINNILVI